MRWTPADVSTALAGVGVIVPASDASIEERDGRSLARLPGERMAWFATNDEGRRKMAIERRVLQVIAARCTFAVPRVLVVGPSGDFDVRSVVPGLAEPWHFYERARSDRAFAASIGRALGAILAEQHARVSSADVEGWLPSRPDWPEPIDSIRERLPRVVSDRTLLDEILALLDDYEAVRVGEDERVLVHADLGLHNIAIDPETWGVRGVFDYEGAAFADRHHDFRYLAFDFDDDSMLAAAISVYEPATGCSLSRERIVLYKAACAASYLALRDGVPPEVASCGRTLAQDLAWMRSALGRLERLRG